MSGRRSRAVRRGLVMAMTAKPGAVGLALVAPHLASAATTAVACNVPALQAAITAANVSGGTLSLASGCTYDIVTPDSPADGLPPISGTMTIAGNGATITRDAAAVDFRIFEVNEPGNLTLQDVTVSNGSTTSTFFAEGGGILNQGTLAVTRSTITGNKSTGITSAIGSAGGGILSTGTTTVTDSTISGNTVQQVRPPGSSAQVLASGGGISAKGGTLVIRNTTISNNSVVASSTTGVVTSSGGGVSAQGGSPLASATGPAVTISGTTISGNTVSATTGAAATATGGAFEQENSSNSAPGVPTVTSTITNSTLAGNSVTSSTPGGNTGGAIHILSRAGDTMLVVNSTIAANSGAAGGGIDHAGPGTATVTNTILATNTGLNCRGIVADGGHNISFPASDASCVNTFANGDPRLGPLQNNGGLTRTMALGTGSAAIDSANGTVCQAPLPAGAGGHDQVGNLRAEVNGDTTCDVGAFEVQAVTIVPSPSPTPPTLPRAGTPDVPVSGTPWPLVVPPVLAAAGALVALGGRRQKPRP